MSFQLYERSAHDELERKRSPRTRSLLYVELRDQERILSYANGEWWVMQAALESACDLPSERTGDGALTAEECAAAATALESRLHATATYLVDRFDGGLVARDPGTSRTTAAENLAATYLAPLAALLRRAGDEGGAVIH